MRAAVPGGRQRIIQELAAENSGLYRQTIDRGFPAFAGGYGAAGAISQIQERKKERERRGPSRSGGFPWLDVASAKEATADTWKGRAPSLRLVPRFRDVDDPPSAAPWLK